MGAVKNGATVKAMIALVLATLFWAGNYVVGGIAVKSISPLDLTWLRWALAAVPLMLLAHFVEKPDWRAALRHWPRLALLAALGVAGYVLLLYTALSYTSALSASLINAANPAVMAVLAAIILRERLGWRVIAGLALGLFGVLLVITNGALGSLLSLRFNTGDLLMLGAILVWSVYTILGRGLSVPPITSTAIQVTMVAIVLVPFAIAGGVSWPDEASVAVSVIFIAIFPSIGAYVLWNIALKQVSPTSAGLYLNLITVFTVIISVILGAQLTLAQAIGGLVVFAGVALSSLKPRKRIAA
jgi:drug/metabolite transporter (DMT)-like permease